MTLRAIILGLSLGLLVSFVVYPNDAVLRGTMLIGNFLPIIIFGTLVASLLLNALVGCLNRRLMLRGSELAVATAIGLVACGYPGSGFYRGATTIPAMPAHWLQTNSKWKNAEITSYVPGGSAQVAQGHMVDPLAVTQLILQPGGPAFQRVESQLTDRQRRDLVRIAGRPGSAGPIDLPDLRLLLATINAAINEPRWVGDSPEVQRSSDVQRALDMAADFQARSTEAAQAQEAERAAYWQSRSQWALSTAARAMLAEESQGAIRPAPNGDAVLLSGMQRHPYTHDGFIAGNTQGKWLSAVPWDAWWPVIRLWGGFTAVLGLCLLCLSLIVHPQWSRRELLPYPIARFVEESVAREDGKRLPGVMRNRLFWIAFGLLLVLHSVNALHVYTDEITPKIPLNLNFDSARTLFPTASRVAGSDGYFHPTIYLSVIAFSFFLTTAVSLSLGLSTLLWIVLGGVLLSKSIPFENDYTDPGNGTMLRVGGYLMMMGIIVYTGRRHYLSVVKGAVGLKRDAETPGYTIWAARFAALLAVGLVLILRETGLAWGWSAFFVSLVVVIHVVISRLVAETGAFYLQASWLPIAVALGAFGFDAIGPSAFIILAIGSYMIIGDPREALMPFVVNALRIGDRSGGADPKKLAPILALMIVTGLIIAGLTVFAFQYNIGHNSADRWASSSMPNKPLDSVEREIGNASSRGSLARSTDPSALSRLEHFKPDTELLLWTALGGGLVLVTAVLRMRVTWWPLHPLIFLVWGTHPLSKFAFSFLLGWMVKATVVKISGARGYTTLRPLAIGVIAGELFALLLWALIGLIYQQVTGNDVPRFAVFPG